MEVFFYINCQYRTIFCILYADCMTRIVNTGAICVQNTKYSSIANVDIRGAGRPGQGGQATPWHLGLKSKISYVAYVWYVQQTKMLCFLCLHGLCAALPAAMVGPVMFSTCPPVPLCAPMSVSSLSCQRRLEPRAGHIVGHAVHAGESIAVLT